MKVLIVDDERHVREAIRMLVDWERLGIEHILEASEGASAVEIIQSEQPDIVLTDMLMPIMNGSELLEWIQLQANFCKTIVISGHDDFGYVRHTIKYGGMDYILKPIDEQQLNEALGKAIEARHADMQKQNAVQDQSIQLNQIKPIYWDKLFSNIMDDSRIYSSFANELRKEFHIMGETMQARVAILSLESMQPAIKDRFASNMDLLSYSLANIANEYLRERQNGYAYRNWSKADEIVIVSWQLVDELPVTISRMNEGIFRTYGVRFDFGIGRPASFPHRLKQSYQEAALALKQRNLVKSSSRIHTFTSFVSTTDRTLYFGKYQEEIRLALLSGNSTHIKLAVNSWFQELKRLDCITMEHLELWLHEFTVFSARCFHSDTMLPDDENDGLKKEAGQYIFPIDEDGRLSVRLWQEEFTTLMLSYSKIMNERNLKLSISQEIAEYIRANYQEELSLQGIADRYHLSREYISRKFKQDTNENISDYIERIRIENSKQLLHNPQLKISQISELVGYQDDKYFSKVFKKVVGLSPNQYRKKINEEHH